MKRFLLAAALAAAALAWAAPQPAAASTNCRWIGEGEALLCDDPPSGGQTLSNWEAGAWTSVPAVVGANFPAVAGGLSSYGQSWPPSVVTPPSSYYSQTWNGNSWTQTGVVYGPGNTSRAVTCVTQYVGGSMTRTCR
jgi:hypothetical protein